MILLWLGLAGLIAGLLGALLGLGGGIFLVPVLTLLFGFPIRIAVATSLVAVIATSAGVAVSASEERGANIALALRLEMVTAAGAVAGGLISGLISTKALNFLFALVVFSTVAYTLYKNSSHQDILFKKDYQVKNWSLGLGISSLAGMISGLLGVGGGFIKVPTMYVVMGVPLGIATSTSNFMVGITAAASVFVYLRRGDVHPFIVAPTTFGVFTGAVLGSILLPHLKVSWLRWALVVLLILIGIQMLLKSLGI